MNELAQMNAPFLDLMQLEPPGSVSMRPDTLAWWFLLGLVLAAGILYLWKRIRTYRKALWKRQARLHALEAKDQAQADPWFALIKRVHLVHRSKSDLLKLDDTGLLTGLPGLDTRVRENLIKAHYRNNEPIPEADYDALYEAFIRWLDGLPVDAVVEQILRDEADD